MNAIEILTLPIDDQLKQLKKTAKDQLLVKQDYETCKKQYDPYLHDVFDLIKRPTKQVMKPTGRKNADGTDEYEERSEDVARIAVPLQKIIVGRITSFLLNKGIGILSNAEQENAAEQNVISMIERLWKNNKLNYKTKQIARLLFSECEVAEIWYFQEDQTIWQKLISMIGIKSVKLSAKMKIVANSLGDTLYPHFDLSGNMDAFCRGYQVTNSDGKVIEKFEIYTAEKILFYAKIDGIWMLDPEIEKSNSPNPLGKIPVVYYSQPYPEWYNVQSMIDRIEKSLSNFADSNDYFGAPMLKIRGKVLGFASKGEQGKIVELDGAESDAEYLTWDQAPEAIKAELDTLQDFVYSLTQTPDISFGKMKDLGNISGISRKLMFLDAHLKCFDKEETFGEGIQRRLNLLKAMVGIIATKYQKDADNIEIWPEFTPYLPDAEEDFVTLLTVATGGKAVISQQTAVKLNPLVKDADEEMKLIEAEGQADIQNPVI